VSEPLLCTRCREVVVPKVVRTLTFDGRVLKEYRCPRCGSVLLIQEERISLPKRGVEKAVGLYIALEGIGGAGKTYFAKRLVALLEERGYSAVYVKEPWIPAIKEFIHKHDLDPDAEAYIFAADRIILQKEVVIPALSENKIVVSDRSVYASIAYQCARGLNEEFLWAINRSIRIPDVVFLLDIPVSEAIRRLKAEGRRLTRYENEEYLRRVRGHYLSLSRRARSSRFYLINAMKSKEEIEKELVYLTLRELKQRSS